MNGLPEQTHRQMPSLTPVQQAEPKYTPVRNMGLPAPLVQPAVVKKDEEVELFNQDMKDFYEGCKQWYSVIPTQIVDYYMSLGGFQSEDKQIAKAVAIATEKFIFDALVDAQAQGELAASSHSNNKTVSTITLEDVSRAFRSRGINIDRPDYVIEQNIN